MNHYTAMIRLVQEKGLTDPPKIGLELLIDRNIRPNAGVDKQIVPEPAAIDEAFQELDVICWYGCARNLDDLLRRAPAQLRYVDSIALQALQAAELEPACDERFVAANDPKKNLLMSS